MVRLPFWTVAIVVFAAAQVANAQTATQSAGTSAKPTPKPNPVNPLIMEQLKSGDDANVELAVQTIEKLVAATPRQRISKDWSMQWIKPLMDYKRYDLVARVSTAMICTMPDEANIVEFFQRAKVTALMAEQKYDEALSAAKGLFNVCTLRSTAKSIDTLAECLAVARAANDPQIARRFRAEQSEGAKSLDGIEDNVLKTVKVDASVYDEPLGRFVIKDYRTLMMRGNILLLADQPSEARACFELAQSVASGKNQLAATEGIARAIRAVDGVIAGANAFLTKEQQSAEP